jgi:hypothetical protein
MIIVVVDFGDDNADQGDDGDRNFSALVVAAVLTVVFLGIATMDYTGDLRLQKQSSTEWHKVAQWFNDDQLNEKGYAKMRDTAEQAAKETASTDQAAQNDDKNQATITLQNPLHDETE